MDTLIIKKNKEISIEKNIGKIFKSHNIVEYKSETDNFTIWDYNKIRGYALIYSSFNNIQLSDITITISLTKYPAKLTETLKTTQGIEIKKIESGIYYIYGDILPIQILESKSLTEEENVFMHNLRSNIGEQRLAKTLSTYAKYKSLDVRNPYIDSLVKANKAYKGGVKYD